LFVLTRTLSVDVLSCGKRSLLSYVHLAHMCTRNLRTWLVVLLPESKRKADEMRTRCHFVIERLDHTRLASRDRFGYRIAPKSRRH